MSVYHFTLDSPITKIIYRLDKKNEVLDFLCKESFKVLLYLGKEPMLFSTISI
jgi:hypothetical protein